MEMNTVQPGSNGFILHKGKNTPLLGRARVQGLPWGSYH